MAPRSVFAVLAAAAAISPTAAEYTRLEHVCLPWLDPLTRVGACGTDHGVPCNVSVLAAACDTTAGCTAFNTNGFLKACPLGGCGCESGPRYCQRGLDIWTTDRDNDGCNNVDLYLRAGAPPPSEWVDAIAAAELLYASPEPPACYMPEVGNGYVATVASWGSMHVAGLYNGRCGSARKARLPSAVAWTLAAGGAPGAVVAAGLDVARGVYARRWAVGGAVVEARVWAHRARRHVLVADLRLVMPPPGRDAVTLNVTSLWDPLDQATAGPGADCAGPFTVDVRFAPPAPGAAPAVYRGVTLAPSDDGELFNVSVVTDGAPATVTLTVAAPGARALTAVATSLDVPGGRGDADAVAALAAAAYAAAAAVAPDALFDEHVAAWAVLHASGVEVAPASASPRDTARARDVAAHANASAYYVLSSLREDVAASTSPGGLATANYEGAIFMDAELWVMPSLYLLAPPLAAAMLEYRFAALPAMRRLAALFGFGGRGGAMAAWTSAHAGNAFGCCAGAGPLEDCLEHHVSGDIAFAAWQYFSATGDADWLARVGFPLLAGLADFHLDRVSPPAPPTAAGVAAGAVFHVAGVLPIDEWCVDAGCGCESPGVDDDALTNAVARASLLLAVRAAAALGNESDRSALWAAVGAGVAPLMNATRGHHDQFNSPTCPGGWGGAHYSARHTVCPEDVLLLSWPLGDFLNTSADVARADAELFAPLTCRENAGMTTPVHTIAWLALGNTTAAQAAFNRSLHAAAYGSFFVRNEVDKHVDVVGASFDNTHFVTGDGGHLNALLYGWGGLRVADAGLRLLPPALPEAVGELTLRRLAWRGAHVTFVVRPATHAVAVLDAPAGACLMLVDAAGGRAALAVGGPALVLDRATYAYPALLTECGAGGAIGRLSWGA